MAKRTPSGFDVSAYFTVVGRKGGLATAKKRTKAERVESARRAVLARWAKQKQTKQTKTKTKKTKKENE
jgi:hypothetical protein